MAIRGETIGTAFVRILASGDGLPESIRREMKKTEKDLERSGEEGSRAYNEGFAAQQKRDKNVEKSLKATIDRAFGKIDADAKLFETDRFSKRLSRNLAHGIEQSFPELKNSAEALGKKISDAIISDHAMTGNFDVNLRKRLKVALADMEHESARSIRKIGQFLDKEGNKIGRAFGSGARNNFFNLFGKAIQAPVEIIARAFIGVDKLITSVGSAWSKVSKTFTDAGSGLSGIGAVIKDNAAGFFKMAGSGIAAAVAVGVLISLLGALVSILSGVLAAVTALASALAFALVGAIAPLAGLIAPLTLGVAALAVAFSGLSKKAKTELAKELHGVTTEFKDLRKHLQEAFFGKGFDQAGKDAKILQAAIKSLSPALTGAAAGMRGFVVNFLAALSSKAAKGFFKTMGDFAAVTLPKLGKAFGNVFVGLGGLFTALQPHTTKFVDWLVKVTGEFAVWANSVAGKKWLKDFLDKAATSAGKVWDLLKKTGAALGLLTDKGKPTGDSIIDELTKKVGDFVTYLKDPKNQKAIGDFFKNGKDTIDNLGKITQKVIDLFVALDTPENRATGQAILSGIADAVGLVSTAFKVLDTPFKVFLASIGGIVTAFAHLKINLSKILFEIELRFALWAQAFVTLAAKALSWIPFLKGPLAKAKKEIDQWVDDTKSKIANLNQTFVIKGILKVQIDAVTKSHLTSQGKAKALEMIWNRSQDAFPPKALGGPVLAQTPYWVGEKGKELFVPDVPGTILPNNDPAVRALMRRPQITQSTTTINRQRPIDASGWTIVTPTADPRGVASEVLNRLTAAAYA